MQFFTCLCLNTIGGHHKEYLTVPCTKRTFEKSAVTYVDHGVRLVYSMNLNLANMLG